MIEKNNRNIWISFRLNDKEMIDFNTLMIRAGYRSRSKFIRSLMFSTPVKRRIFEKTNEKIPEILTQFLSDFKKVGVNYNQYVRSFNSILKAKTKDGQAVASMASAKYAAISLKKETEKMIKIFREINEILSSKI